MSDIAIRVENLSKKYRIGANQARYHTLRESIMNGVSTSLERLKGNQPQEENIIWALKDINFEVKHGEVLGIIGRNGAGKSTLLKILSRITKPTTGRFELNGRVGSLLEVGTGFHPELTGRENIFLSGAILGMKRKEINRKFDEIVDFAEIEKFLDTPVKHYSSGMYMRLAFSVAAHLEPEILLVDEVLAVGDAEFQKKCLGKMGDVAGEGRTVLFVSHNMGAIENICNKGLFLQNGRIILVSSQTKAINEYLKTTKTQENALLQRKDRIGNGEVIVEHIEYVDKDGNQISSVISGQELGIRIFFRKYGSSTYHRIISSILVRTEMDIPVFLQHNRLTKNYFGNLPSQGYFELRIYKLPLPPANYLISISLIENDTFIDGINNAAKLIVTSGDFFGSGEVPPQSHGLCLVDGHWSIQNLSKQ